MCEYQPNQYVLVTTDDDEEVHSIVIKQEGEILHLRSFDNDGNLYEWKCDTRQYEIWVTEDDECGYKGLAFAAYQLVSLTDIAPKNPTSISTGDTFLEKVLSKSDLPATQEIKQYLKTLPNPGKSHPLTVEALSSLFSNEPIWRQAFLHAQAWENKDWLNKVQPLLFDKNTNEEVAKNVLASAPYQALSELAATEEDLWWSDWVITFFRRIPDKKAFEVQPVIELFEKVYKEQTLVTDDLRALALELYRLIPEFCHLTERGRALLKPGINQTDGEKTALS